MTRTNYKRFPFSLKLAKKIMNEASNGRIVTRDGRRARIICFDRKKVEDIFDPPKNIIALVETKDGGEGVFEVRDNGMILAEETDYDLQIEVPVYSDYSNFVPQKWQPCLVRDFSSDKWKVTVCSGKDAYGVPIFYSVHNSDGHCHWGHSLPLSKVTARLIGTTKSYEQLIQELDKNDQD